MGYYEEGYLQLSKTQYTVTDKKDNEFLCVVKIGEWWRVKTPHPNYCPLFNVSQILSFCLVLQPATYVLQNQTEELSML